MPVVGLAVSVLANPVTVSLSGLAFISAYENDKGFRAPSRIYASTRVSVAFLDGMLRPFAGMELGHESEEYWHGEAGHEGSNIRTELYGSTGIAVRVYEAWTVDATIRGRIASLTDAPTFEVPVMVNLGVMTYFDLWGDAKQAAPGTGPKVEERIEDGEVIFEKK